MDGHLLTDRERIMCPKLVLLVIGLSHSSPFRDKPYLLFFDIIKCATVVSVGELIQGQVDTSSIFTCPTQQVQMTVNYTTCLVYTLV